MSESEMGSAAEQAHGVGLSGVEDRTLLCEETQARWTSRSLTMTGLACTVQSVDPLNRFCSLVFLSVTTMRHVTASEWSWKTCC